MSLEMKVMINNFNLLTEILNIDNNKNGVFEFVITTFFFKREDMHYVTNLFKLESLRVMHITANVSIITPTEIHKTKIADENITRSK